MLTQGYVALGFLGAVAAPASYALADSIAPHIERAIARLRAFRLTVCIYAGARNKPVTFRLGAAKPAPHAIARKIAEHKNSRALRG